jgi:hypothetical protein
LMNCWNTSFICLKESQCRKIILFNQRREVAKNSSIWSLLNKTSTPH